ncbi:hypothetical protein PFISCL1PPCAC_6507, partial [Pristionchus fissidentatus]
KEDIEMLSLKFLCMFLLVLCCTIAFSAELTPGSQELDLDGMFFSPYRIGKRSNFYAMDKKFAKIRPHANIADFLTRDYRK